MANQEQNTKSKPPKTPDPTATRLLRIIAFVVCIPVIAVTALFAEQFAVAVGFPKFIAGGATFWVGVICAGWVTLTNKRII